MMGSRDRSVEDLFSIPLSLSPSLPSVDDPKEEGKYSAHCGKRQIIFRECFRKSISLGNRLKLRRRPATLASSMEVAGE